MTEWPSRKELKILLIEKGITQAQIARQINKSRSLISRILNGERKSDQTRQEIAGAMGIRYQPPEAPE